MGTGAMGREKEPWGQGQGSVATGMDWLWGQGWGYRDRDKPSPAATTCLGPPRGQGLGAPERGDPASIRPQPPQTRTRRRLPHVPFIQTMTTGPLWAVGTGEGSPAEVKYPMSARTPALSPGCSPSCTPMATGPPRPPVSAASPA